MSWGNNAYDTPEMFGLEILKVIEDPDASYDFDTMVLFRHVETGALYWAQDSGCSCPSPFEDYDSIESLSLLSDAAWPEFEAEVNAWNEYKGAEGETQALRTEMLGAAARALREQTR